MMQNLLLKFVTASVLRAPEGYTELMQECWNSDPDMRPIANVIWSKLNKMSLVEFLMKQQRL